MSSDSGVADVGAPVPGTRRPAEAGALAILAAGPAHVRDRVQPLFDVIGSRTIGLDEPGEPSSVGVV